MEYKEIQPCEALSRYVRFFWTLDNVALSKTFKVVADGSPGLIFQHSQDGPLLQNSKAIPELFLFGQATRHADISLGKSVTIGICFYPDALSTLFNINANELTDNCLDMDHLHFAREYFLQEQLYHSTTANESIRILSLFLLAQIKKYAPVNDPVISSALPMIIASQGKIPLKNLHQSLQISERGLERRFKQSIGISPKLFSRICSFQASLDKLKDTSSSLTEIAYEYGYADQSHFIRSFREFAGLSPFQYQKKSQKVTANFPELVR